MQGGVTKALAGTTLAELVEFSRPGAPQRAPRSAAPPSIPNFDNPRNGDEIG